LASVCRTLSGIALGLHLVRYRLLLLRGLGGSEYTFLSHLKDEVLTNGCRYYIAFIVASCVAAVYYMLFMPETKGLNLEEIAAAFRDVVCTDEKGDIGEADKKVEQVHIEDEKSPGLIEGGCSVCIRFIRDLM
jgi:hypothetical protein